MTAPYPLHQGTPLDSESSAYEDEVCTVENGGRSKEGWSSRAGSRLKQI